MLTYKCLAWICQKVGRFVKKAVRFFQENLSLLWKAIVILGGISFLEWFGILVTAYAPGAEVVIWLLYRAATLVLIMLGIVQGK